MKYFAINFPNFTTFILKTGSSHDVKSITGALSEATGLLGVGGSAFNPKHFISVDSISSPDDRQKKLARDIDKVLF